MFKRLALPILVSLVFIAPAQAGVTLIASGALNGTSDLSGLSGALENGVAANVLGGMGSGLAWAGGNTFLALPDRGPNASSYAGGGAIDNTTSYIDRFQTITLNLTQSQSAGSFSYALSTALNQTTLLYSPNALNYGSTVGLPSAVPVQNTAERNYFTGRSTTLLRVTRWRRITPAWTLKEFGLPTMARASTFLTNMVPMYASLTVQAVR